ncbi:ATP-binding cassette domain-containing protein, partial [Veillonella infantium]|uniref:ATP-binding cassette domain-containing protein n=1 Tax=Veillonella infantium TaxID=1911679 RepID=UPI0026EB9CA3
MIAIRNVTKEFDVNKQKVTALSDVNFTIEKGDIFGIIGFSGAGKSTLLRMINALEVPTSGHVEIDICCLRWFPTQRGFHLFRFESAFADQ